MRRLTLLLTLVGAVLLAFSGVAAAQNSSAPAPSQQPAKGENDVIPDQYIIVLKDKEDSKKVSDEHAQKHSAKIKHLYKSAIKGYSATIPSERLKDVEADPRVQFVSKTTRSVRFSRPARRSRRASIASTQSRAAQLRALVAE